MDGKYLADAGSRLGGLESDHKTACAACSATHAAHFASVPETARGPVLGEKGYHVEEIRDRVYWVSAGYYDTMFMATGAGVVAIDAPPGLGPNMTKAIREVTDEPITHVIYSHSHFDHIGAADQYPANAVRIAHAITAEKLGRYPDAHRPPPTVTFTDTHTLQVGDKRIELAYRGNNHEPGNIFIHVPKQKVLMLVDVIFPGWVPFRNLAMADDIEGYLAAHDAILTYDFDTLVAGHLNRYGTRHDVEVQREYMHNLKDASKRALATVSLQAVGARTGFDNAWVFFDGYMNDLIKMATDEVLTKKTSDGRLWTERLGGADVWTHHHAFAMIQSLRIENPNG